MSQSWKYLITDNVFLIKTANVLKLQISHNGQCLFDKNWKCLKTENISQRTMSFLIKTENVSQPTMSQQKLLELTVSFYWKCLATDNVFSLHSWHCHFWLCLVTEVVSCLTFVRNGKCLLDFRFVAFIMFFELFPYLMLSKWPWTRWTWCFRPLNGAQIWRNWFCCWLNLIVIVNWRPDWLSSVPQDLI